MWSDKNKITAIKTQYGYMLIDYVFCDRRDESFFCEDDEYIPLLYGHGAWSNKKNSESNSVFC